MVAKGYKGSKCKQYNFYSFSFLSIDGIDKTRWSCPWNSDQNCTQNWWVSRGGWVEAGGVVGSRGWMCRGCGVQGVEVGV